jgi:hypothetical protein
MIAPSPELLRDPLGLVRSRCAVVAHRARFVNIDDRALEDCAGSLPLDEIGQVPAHAGPELRGDRLTRSAFVICLDAINFGSGWFPQLAKLPGLSGYRTVEARLRDWFARRGAPSPAELSRFDAAQMTELLAQAQAGPDIPELMQLFALAWRHLGELVERDFGADFGRMLDEAGGSAVQLIRTLLRMPLYRDVVRYDGLEVPLLKRAQITAADLGTAGLAAFEDLDQLTMFADNLVPHVLRLDGVLRYAPELLARINREELLVVGSAEETEIRACAVTAVERLRSLIAQRGGAVRAIDLDYWLWNRGAGASYKAQPRHRARSSFY